MTFEAPFFLPYDRQNFRFRKLAEICRGRTDMQHLVGKGDRAYRVVSHIPFCGSVNSSMVGRGLAHGPNGLHVSFIRPGLTSGQLRNWQRTYETDI